MPQSQLPRHFARPTRQRHESRRVGVKYRYGVVRSEAAGVTSPAGVGLTGSGVRRGRSVGAGVAVGAVLGAGVAGAWVGAGVGAVLGAGVAGVVVGAAVVDSTTGFTFEAIAAETTKAPPAAAMVTKTTAKAVAAAANGRMTRATRVGRAVRLACTARKTWLARWAGRGAGCRRPKAAVSWL